MFDRERFECDPTNFRRHTLFDHVAILDRVMPQFLPRFFRRIHRTRRALLQSPGVIGMRVREYDHAGIYAFQFSQPIKRTIDHHFCTAIRNQQRCMHTMPPRAHVELAACADKLQLHWNHSRHPERSRGNPWLLRSVLSRDPSTRFAPLGMTVIAVLNRRSSTKLSKGRILVMETTNRSPRINHVSWGRLEVEGKAEPYKDAKLFPGGLREWNWRE